ncbi:MAG: serine hydrolase [Synechocystis sp.]|jgi:beta-lactamase class A
MAAALSGLFFQRRRPWLSQLVFALLTAITSMPRPKSRRSQRRNLRVVSGLSTVAAFPQQNHQVQINDKVTAISIVAEPVGQQQTPPRLRKVSKPQSAWQRWVLGCVRVGILGIGLGAIAGTTLTTLTPTRFIQADQDQQKNKNATLVATTETPPTSQNPIYPQKVLASVSDWAATSTAKLWPASATATNQTQDPSKAQMVPVVEGQKTSTLTPKSENTALKAKLTKLASATAPKIVPYAYFIDVDNGQFVSLNGNHALPAASTIKIPVAIAFFQAVDQGKIKLDEKLALTKDVIGSGAGTMQYEMGKRDSYSALEVVTQMIVISDNTATNMLIKRLGGMDSLNRQFQTWQLPQTKINNLLPDLEGTNTTSPQDLAMILVKLQDGNLLSLKSRDRLLNIMQQTKTRTLLPQGLEPDAIIAHKTGDIGKVIGDAGVIDMPSGKRYVGAVIATRPYNDPAARTLIQDMSRTVYQHYKGMNPPAPAPTVATKTQVEKPQPEKPKANPSPAAQPKAEKSQTPKTQPTIKPATPPSPKPSEP